MKHSATMAIGMFLAFATCMARADTVIDWNLTTIEVMKVANVRLGSGPGLRTSAMVHVAMSDAINSVQGRYTRYVTTVPAVPSASAEAAAAAAARQILIQLYPNQKAMIDEAYAASVKDIPDGPAKSDGVALGEQVAAAVQADRSADGTSVPDTYRPFTSPGVWVPTTPPLFAQYARAKPWVLKSADQFRPNPPPQLSSELYARDYNETKTLGGAKSTARTPEQTAAVKFWDTETLAPAWQAAARQLSAAKGLTFAENARLFALLNLGVANSVIADWDAKFTYNFWRPVTAIRNGDMDGNGATERDPGWTSLNATPMHPEYPSQAAIAAGVSVGVLEAVFGRNLAIAVTATYFMDPKLTRQFNSIAQMAEEHANVRIWGGIHFRNSLDVGYDMGRKIAAYLVENSIRPVR
ncbi:MAG: vanadium-dependent haloperoxidase [Burkholderiales bacterium]